MGTLSKIIDLTPSQGTTVQQTEDGANLWGMGDTGNGVPRIQGEFTVVGKNFAFASNTESFEFDCVREAILVDLGELESEPGRGFGSKVLELKEEGLVPHNGRLASGLALVSARGMCGRLELKFENQGAARLRGQIVSVYARGNQRVWKRKFNLGSGKQQYYKLDVSRLDLPRGVRGLQRLEIRADDVSLGTVMVDTGARGAGPGAAQPVAVPPAPAQPAAEARVKITLSADRVRLKENERVTLDLRFDNNGRAASKRGVYTVRCTPRCPFPKTRGSIKRLEPNDAKRYPLTSEGLDPGSYTVYVETPYGNSNQVRFSVEEKPERKPDRRTPKTQTGKITASGSGAN